MVNMYKAAWEYTDQPPVFGGNDPETKQSEVDAFIAGATGEERPDGVGFLGMAVRDAYDAGTQWATNQTDRSER